MPAKNKKLFFYVQAQWRVWLLGLLLLLGTNILQMYIPQLFKNAVDKLLNPAQETHHAVSFLVAKMVLAAILSMVLRTGSRVYLFTAARNIEMEIRSDYYHRLTSVPLSFFYRYSCGDLMSRATQDLAQIRLLFGPGVLNSINALSVYILAVPFMWNISPTLTWVGFLFYPPVILFMAIRGRSLFKASREQSEHLGALTQVVQDSLSHIHLIRQNQAYARCEDIFAQYNQHYFAASLKQLSSRAGIFRITTSLAALSSLVCFYVGATMVMNNRLSVGSLMAMTEYLLLLSWPTFALGWVTTLYQRGQAGLKRVFEVLHAPIEAEPALSDVSNGVFLPIVARNIFSAYGNTEVLQDISFTLEKGKMLAIVGPIGSGKTSLLFTLAQLLTISQGKLLAGEHLLTNIPKAEWWRQCALVPQKPLLFSATLRDNITFGVSHITDLELLNILEQVQLTKDIQALPEGLDTRVGEMGINLSGGQKVRVALARALLRKPRILLLDDVIAALDTEVALALQRALLAAHGETTLIMTSHRLQSVVHADEILVLREGRVVQQGNHKALMLEDGWYRDIFQMQSAREDSRPC